MAKEMGSRVLDPYNMARLQEWGTVPHCWRRAIYHWKFSPMSSKKWYLSNYLGQYIGLNSPKESSPLRRTPSENGHLELWSLRGPSVCNLVPRSLIDKAEGEIWSSKKVQFFWLARLWGRDVSAVICVRNMRYDVYNSFFAKSSVLFKTVFSWNNYK